MLATRSLRLAAVRYVHPTHCLWSSSVNTIPVLQTSAIKWITRPTLAATYSKDVKSEGPTTSTSLPKSSSSASNTAPGTKTQTPNSPKDTVCEATVKLPSKDQIESFAFKFLVYSWDFAYYVFCMCRKLFDTYVMKNSTVQQNWKQLLKRMEEARKEIKTK